MSCKKFIRGVAMLCVSSFLWVSCQKENSTPSSDPAASSANLKLSGVVPDDPALVAKVPMITSADFLADHITNYVGYPSSTQSARGGGSTGRDKTTPTVNITSPTTGSTVSGTVNVQVTATDNVGVSSVVLKVDGNIIGNRTLAPYTFSWNTTGLSSGTHTLTATATDAAGNSKISTIQVGYNTPSGADITPPLVTITSPSNGSSVESTITVGIAASDNIGVSNVSFQVDGVIVGTDNSAPYSFLWNTTTVAAGIHTLTAKATDAAGNANSNSVQVTVNTTIVIPPPTLPSAVQLIMPPVGHQAGENSCVAFSTAYAARSAELFYKTNATSYNFGTNIFSPEFLFNQVKTGDCRSGSAITTSLNYMMTTGICKWETMPYLAGNGCTLVPTVDQFAEAATYKISSYSTIISADSTAIKTMLFNKHPVIIMIAPDQSFSDAQPGFIWKSFVGSPGPSHSVVICGYDDSKHAYKIMNSWGTSWADAGFSWIDYDFLAQCTFYYSYVINN